MNDFYSFVLLSMAISAAVVFAIRKIQTASRIRRETAQAKKINGFVKGLSDADGQLPDWLIEKFKIRDGEGFVIEAVGPNGEIVGTLGGRGCLWSGYLADGSTRNYGEDRGRVGKDAVMGSVHPTRLVEIIMNNEPEPHPPVETLYPNSGQPILWSNKQSFIVSAVVEQLKKGSTVKAYPVRIVNGEVEPAGDPIVLRPALHT